MRALDLFLLTFADCVCTDGPHFIETLFTVLRTKSYIPYASSSELARSGSNSFPTDSDSGIPIPLDAILSPQIPTGPRKRSLEDSEGNRPPKGPRLGNYANGRHDRREYNPMANGMMGGGMGQMGHVNPARNGPDRPKIFIPPEQLNGVCRDYHSACSGLA